MYTRRRLIINPHFRINKCIKQIEINFFSCYRSSFVDFLMWWILFSTAREEHSIQHSVWHVYHPVFFCLWPKNLPKRNIREVIYDFLKQNFENAVWTQALEELEVTVCQIGWVHRVSKDSNSSCFECSVGCLGFVRSGVIVLTQSPQTLTFLLSELII